VWNGAIDRRPAVVARCVDLHDARAALGFAQDEGLLVAVRGGGHNVAGLSTCDDGIVIDLGPMNGVRIDASTRTATAGDPASSGGSSTAPPSGSGWPRPAVRSPTPGSPGSA
jgi:UDP-N-acetylenolpyruvoylglucosamine reductase